MTSYSSSSEPIPEEIAPTLYRYAQEAGGKAVWVTEFAKEDGLFLTRSIREVEHLSLATSGYPNAPEIDIDRLISAASNFHQDYNSAYYVLTDGTNRHLSSGKGRRILLSKSYPTFPMTPILLSHWSARNISQ